MYVSVIIPNYNGRFFIEKCIDSLKNQTYKNYEIIVIDNASSDDSIEIINKKYKDIKIVKNNENLGCSIAANQGIKISKGEFVFLLNNDTELDENCIEELLKSINKDENIFSVGSKMIQYKNRTLIDDAGDDYTILGWAVKNGDGASVDKFSTEREVFSCCSGAAMYRKEIFDKIGYVDEQFFAYMEDVEIGYRAKIFGYKNIFSHKSKVYHIGSGTSGSRYNEFKVKLASRNNLYLIYKSMPLLQLLINLPFLILGILIKYLFFLKKGFGKIYLEGLIEGLSTLNKVKKTKFKVGNLKNYIKIEYLLIKNTFKHIISRIKI